MASLENCWYGVQVHSEEEDRAKEERRVMGLLLLSSELDGRSEGVEVGEYLDSEAYDC